MCYSSYVNSTWLFNYVNEQDVVFILALAFLFNTIDTANAKLEYTAQFAKQGDWSVSQYVDYQYAPGYPFISMTTVLHNAFISTAIGQNFTMSTGIVVRRFKIFYLIFSGYSWNPKL